MQWYEALTDDISMKDIYSHKELIGKLKNLKAGLSDGTYNWILSSLVREGQLFRQGYDAYCLPGGITKAEYRPDYSQDAQRVMNDIQNKYPYVRFTVFETVLMNEFLYHLVANNTMYVQVESRYNIDKVRMLRYARRRNRQDEVKKYMEEQLIIPITY